MDNFYRDVFGPRLWKSVRLALHAAPKRVALVNNYATNSGATAEKLRAAGCVPVEDILRLSLSEDPGLAGRGKKFAQALVVDESDALSSASVVQGSGEDGGQKKVADLEEEFEDAEEDARFVGSPPKHKPITVVTSKIRK